MSNTDLSEKHKHITGHDYDGITELDNPPPPWLMNLFYITIAISMAYAGYYHWFKQGDLQAAEYEKEMAKNQESVKKDSTGAEKVLVLLEDAKSLEAGGVLFSQNCASCHGMHGEGTIGPNLCDDHWITGNTFEKITSTVKNGTPNGMTAFPAFNNEQLSQVSSFILKKLQGTSPSNAKAPQGTKM